MDHITDNDMPIDFFPPDILKDADEDDAATGPASSAYDWPSPREFVE